MPYIRKHFTQCYFETELVHGSLVANDEAVVEKWKKSVQKTHGKDVEFWSYRFEQYVWEEPPKVEKAKKEDES